MKGPKIEDIRDPKWIGKKVTQSNYSFGEGRYFEIKGRNESVIFGVNFKYGEDLGWQSYSKNDYWYEWIESEEEKKPEFPFKIGDRIRRKNWSHDDFIIVQSISEYYIYGCNGNGTSGHMFDYPKVIDIPNSEWELYIPPKKKKTYSMALLKFKEYETSRPFEFLGPFSSKEDVPTDSYEIIQFPAVTKDGTVLEFEVDDE